MYTFCETCGRMILDYKNKEHPYICRFCHFVISFAEGLVIDLELEDIIKYINESDEHIGLMRSNMPKSIN